MPTKNKVLTAAVLLACSCLLAPYYAHAEEEDIPDCEHGHHYMNITVGESSNALDYNFDIYTASTHPGEHWRGEYQTDEEDNPILDANGEKIKVYTSYRDFFAGEERAFNKSIAYIHNMIQPSPTETVPVIKLELLPDQDANAAAESDTYITFNDAGKPVQISDTKLAAVLQGKYQPEDADAEPVANVEVNLAPPSSSWYIDKFPVLPSNGTNSDYYGTITHEMFHALGLGTYISKDTSGKVTFGTSGNYYVDGYYKSMAVFNKYEMGIRDAFGRVAYYASNENGNTYYDGGAGEEQPINPNADNITINGELVSRTIVPITLADYNDLKTSGAFEPDEFYVLQGDDVGTNSGAYFTGTNVKEVLTTDHQLARIAWPDGSTAPAVPGLPLNGYESDDGTPPELSHIELQNVNMSHQAYRNWCSFTEAELALMQDLGYNIDRRAYFGKSIYNSGITYENAQGFYNRIQDANDNWIYGNEPNTTMHGIGLHIYGSNNTITQTGKILANGYSGIGIRVDGVGNKVTINTDITANGDYGNGLLVAYGKNHEITLNEGKSIEAIGEDGVAARFDFGSNELGDFYGYRGSYINTTYTSQEELDSMEAESPGSTAGIQVGWREITGDKLPDAINGELVTNFNIAGTLKGEKAAIYISPNALVKNINILQGANIQGDIISEWNPEAILYQNNDGETLAPRLPYGENGLTNLNFNGTHTFNDDIIGKDSIVLNVGTTTATSSLTTGDNSVVNVKGLNVGGSTLNSTFNNKGDLYVDQGMGEITIASGSTLDSNGGRIFSQVDNDGALLQITGGGKLKLYGSTLLLGMKHDFYDGNVELTWYTSNIQLEGNPTIKLYEQSPTLDFTGTLDAANNRYIISMHRNYEQYAYDAGTGSLANALVQNAAFLGKTSAHAADWQKIYESIDFSKNDGSAVPGLLKQLNPSVYSNSSQATITTHSMLNNMNMLGSFSSLNAPPAHTGGGRGPTVDAAPQYNAWRNIVMPFSAYTDQHNGMRGFTNHNSGVIGAMERTLENGLTHGYHAALNHQSTSEAGSRIKGEGLYLGTQATFAPADWNGWSVFGSARLGLEQMRSHRNINIGGYTGTADADWTGYSGSLSLGTALTKEHGVMQSGPFAALDYSFAHRPSVHEDGDAIRTNLESATYDSLRTQLGYRLTTKPKALDSYDSTNWQAHASVAWNHELLSDNGSTSYQLADLPGVTITDKAETYGRDSMSIAAGVIFKTPNRLDVGITLGSDIYRHGGSSIYGKMNFEWKF